MLLHSTMFLGSVQNWLLLIHFPITSLNLDDIIFAMILVSTHKSDIGLQDDNRDGSSPFLKEL